MATPKSKRRALITAMLIIVHNGDKARGCAPREFHGLFDLPALLVGTFRRVVALLLPSFIKP